MRTVVALKVYKGKALYDENGKIQSESQKITLDYENEEYARKKGWEVQLAMLPRQGFTKVEIMAVYLDEKPIETPEAIATDVAALFAKKDAVLTPQEKKLAELERENAEMKEMMKQILEGKKADKKEPAEKKEAPQADDELKAARNAYEKHFGKKGGPAWDAATLYAKIEEDKLKNPKQ